MKSLGIIVPMKDLTPEQIRDYRNAKTCFNCGVEFSSDQDDENYAKNMHHQHLDGQYIGPACTRCNLQMKYKQATRPKKNKPATYEIPIFFHNLRGFDSHLILEHFPALTSKDRVNCIATNFEQFLTFVIPGTEIRRFIPVPESVTIHSGRKLEKVRWRKVRAHQTSFQWTFWPGYEEGRVLLFLHGLFWEIRRKTTAIYRVFLQRLVRHAHHRVRVRACAGCVESVRYVDTQRIPRHVLGYRCSHIGWHHDRVFQSVYEGLWTRPEALYQFSVFQLGRSFL